jgi:hypothetical protein
MPSSARALPRIQRTTDSRAAASAWGKSIDGVEQPAHQDGQAVSRYRLLLAVAGRTAPIEPTGRVKLAPQPEGADRQ